MSNSNVAWIVGSTGLVGRHALLALLEDQSFTRVVSLVRRPSGVVNPRLEERTIDFEALSRELMGQRADVAICCLGTTIKQAGSKEQFRHVDFDYALAFAQCALSAGVRHFIVVTALGSDAKSRVFYNRVKGELEDALTSFGFPALTIVRPSLLIGERAEARLGEKIAAPLMRLMPKAVRGIAGEKVGRALAKLAREPGQKKRIVLSKELQDLTV